MSATRFLVDAVSEKQKGEKISIRALSRQMGFASHTLLLMILQGKRRLKVKHSDFIARGFSLNSSEKLYLQGIIQYENASEIEEKQLCQVWLSSLHPDNKVQNNPEIDEYKFFSDWRHTAVLAATHLEDGIYSARDIVNLFRQHFTYSQAQSVIKRLICLDLLRTTKSGKLVSRYKSIQSKDDVVNKAIQVYHQSMCNIASVAVTNFAVDQREFQSLSIPVREDQLPLAKDLIRKFRTQFVKTLGSENGNSVYQLNIQFFQLTERQETNKVS